MAGFWVVLLLFIGVGYTIAFVRKGKVSSASLGSRRSELFSPADPATVFDRIATMRGRFTVDDKDREHKILVLSSPVTFFTWGFLYPVYLEPMGTGTRIQIGCHSKFFQLGPLVTKSHNECVAAIESSLSIPEARIA